MLIRPQPFAEHALVEYVVREVFFAVDHLCAFETHVSNTLLSIQNPLTSSLSSDLVSFHHRPMLLLLLITLSSLFRGSVAILLSDSCYTDISGIYLGRYLGQNNSNNSYGLVSYFPLGGVFQLNSRAKQKTNFYQSDLAGFFQCENLPKSRKTKLSYTGFLFVAQSPKNSTINLLKASAKCRGAKRSCTDNAVECARGRLRTQSYSLRLLNADTGNFDDPLPDTLITQRFHTQRLLKHPTVTNSNRDRCYNDMRGTYISRYQDGEYHIISYFSVGYATSTDSKERRTDCTYQYSTYIDRFNADILGMETVIDDAVSVFLI